jgi:hypothetical protein
MQKEREVFSSLGMKRFGESPEVYKNPAQVAFMKVILKDKQ